MNHFNVFKLDDFVGSNSKPIPYSRKDFFKISLIIGRNKVFYGDKVIEIKKQALLFANLQIPYNWEAIDGCQTGFFCVFTSAFFIISEIWKTMIYLNPMAHRFLN